MKRIVPECRIGAERDQQLDHPEIAAPGGIVQCGAIQTAVRNHAVDLGAEFDQQGHAVTLACLDGAM